MQELTFEQVEVVSGGFATTLGSPLGSQTGPFVVNDYNVQNQQDAVTNCRSYDGQPLSPGLVGAGAATIGVVSGINPWVGAAMAGFFGWLSAAVAQGGTTCGTPLTREQYNEIIDRGLETGGPL